MHAVEVEGVTLERRTQEEFSYDLKRLLFTIIERGFRKTHKRRVLQNVSFSVERGEKLGIIGGNGSGKSTILKVICGILQPTSGRVKVSGRIAPLIELGAGFDPELSISDNIIYYGNLLGFSRADMRARLGQILAFAELEDYALLPLKALSSGMNARLGFAIATDVRPEILILDEVLAVGDEAFRVKSTERIQRFWDAHSTIIVVSHDLSFIGEQCERALWLDQGVVSAIGPARDIVALYLAHVSANDPAKSATAQAIGYVDEVQVSNNLLFVRGWILADNTGRTGSRVAIYYDGHFVGNATYGERRDDVSVAFGSDQAGFSGFRGSFALDSLPPAMSNTVECALLDEREAELHRVSKRLCFEVPSASSLLQAHS